MDSRAAALWGTNWQPYLLTPVGTPFDWNYGQHAPELTPQARCCSSTTTLTKPVLSILLWLIQDNYSSAVEYSIYETNMTVSEVWNSAWQTIKTGSIRHRGRVQWLPQTRNVFVTYGYITY